MNRIKFSSDHLNHEVVTATMVKPSCNLYESVNLMSRVVSFIYAGTQPHILITTP